jgi:hypothetical protein
MQYTYIVGKYIICVYQVEKWVFCELFYHVSQRVQIKFIFNDNVRILCLSCNIKKYKRIAKLSENSWNETSVVQILFIGVHCDYSCYRFFLSLYMNQILEMSY